MNAHPDKPSMLRFVGLFAVVYIPLLMLAGLAKLHFGFSTDLNAPVLLTAGIIVASVFTLRYGRFLSRNEVAALSLGSFVIDAVLQLGVTVMLTEDTAVLFSWHIWFVLILHLVGLFFIYGVISKTITKSILEASEKGKHNKSLEDTSHSADPQ